jgi:L,D-transpeptidase catalytic domain/Putative peptidoglycan binding domain
VANVSYLRPAGDSERSARGSGRSTSPSARAPRGRWILGGVLLVVIAAVVVGGVMVGSSTAKISAGESSLASLDVPMGGGKIESVSVRTGPHSRSVPVQVRGDQIWPTTLIPAHQRVSIDAVVKRPGWISWLAGSSEHVHLTLITPVASLRTHYLTLPAGSPIRLQFKAPIRVISYGQQGGRLHRKVLATPLSELNLRRTASAGTLWVAAAPRSWETSKEAVVSWFPAGAAAGAVATPAPGTKIKPNTPITLTFSKPVQRALGSHLPPVSPATPGTWHTISDHSIEFRPEGYGYGLGANVSIGLPNGVKLAGGSPNWTVPGGSTTRLQQLLANLGYLPLRFKGPRVAHTPAGQEAAAIRPPSGHFAWRYPNVPSALRNFWSPGSSGVMTAGALMAFQNDHGMTTDGVAGAAVWRALINAADQSRNSSFGYSFAMVSLGGQSLNLWHNGHSVLTTPVNTGISSRPTDPGTFPVYEHIRVGTMSGTNPDGSHYDDPGIQFISYFNGGDALHAFTRAQYGFPQSLGCVEMALGPAGQVWPYTPIGTLVHVA